jgi:prepilin-type N-terminal cleavage/methylation domain-containing protein
MKKRGFTLIELLAVIVILSIVALITIPLVLGIIGKFQKSSYEASLRSVFGAADLFIASNEFDVFPEEGINIIDDRIQIKNKNFTSGKILKNEDGILELDKVSNGKYCAGGTYKEIIIIEGSCDALDTTPPILSITSNLVTSSSITIVATAEDSESGINGYQFSKDNGSTWTTKQISNVYNFTGLTNDTSYSFKVRVYNNNELSTVSEELSITTTDIEIPTYSINPTGWTTSAIVLINYPERKAGYVYEYSLDGAITWLLVETPSATKEITFTDNGSVIARITDGTNEISGILFEVTNIDTTPPVITVNPTTVNVKVGSAYTNNGVTALDDMLGDITSEIEVTSNLDLNNPGEYTVTYNVSDLAGNEATTKTRTVIVTIDPISDNKILPNIYTSNNYYKSVDIEIKGVTATNVIGSYGDFSTDTSGNGVADNFALYQATNPILSNNVQSFTTSYGIYYAKSKYVQPVVVGNKYYTVAEVKSPVSGTYLTTESATGSWATHTGSDLFETLANIYIPTNTVNSVILYNANPGITIQTRKWRIIDLTSDFGINNEPTKAESDIIFPKYFDNTKNTSVTFISEGKNLFNKAKAENGSVDVYGQNITDGGSFSYGFRSEYIVVEPNTAYTFSGLDSNAKSWHFEYDENFNFIVRSGHTNRSILSFTTSSTTKYIRVVHDLFGSTATRTSALNNLSLQLEKSNTATTFQPYISSTNTVNLLHNQTITINLPLYVEGRIRKEVAEINSWTTKYTYKK